MPSQAKVAVVTGAGSGVGRAIALRLVRESWRVALVGRTRESLAETRELSGSAEPALFPCDIGDHAGVVALATAVIGQFGRVDALVNAAGTNTPRRSLAEVSAADFERILATNLHGAFHCVQQFLPALRRQGGTIVNINSDAGLRANAKAGAAYVASKFGLQGLTQAINAEERAHGIRACGIYPGDINTPLLQKRPVVPGTEERARMLQPDDLAECAWLAISLPARAIVEELLVRPASAP